MRSTWSQKSPKSHQLVGYANQLCTTRRQRSPSEAQLTRESNSELISSNRSRLRLQVTSSNAIKLSAMNAAVMGT